MNLQKILWAEAHWNINKAVAQKVWLEWALLLAHLISFSNYFWKKWKLVKTKYWDWFFSQTEKQLEEQTFISRRWQDKAIKILKENWFIEQVLAWNPAKKHFRILSENIFNFLVNSENLEEEKNEENSLPNKFGQNEQTEDFDKQDWTEIVNKFEQNEQTIIILEKEINKKDNNTNVLLWAEAQKTSDLINFSENEKIENSNDELEAEELEKESDKNSALTENPVYGKAEINDTLDFLKKIIWVSDFKESQKMQRIFWKHIFNLWQKIWKEDFVFRLKNILKDSFKAKNCNSLKYLYSELKAFIHSPLVEVEPEKTKRKVTFW